MSTHKATNLIDMQIMWNRLISVVEEQAQALIRTAFSTIVRECGICRPACSTPKAGCWRRPSRARRATSTRWPSWSSTSSGTFQLQR